MNAGPAQFDDGFTLVELVIAIVVLALGATTYLLLVNRSLERSGNPIVEQQAYAVAQSYMEEILANPFCDPDFSTDCKADCTSATACSTCSISEGSRSLFDDVCDYDGLSDAGAEDFTGAIPGLSNYNVDVTVDDSGVTLNGLSSASGQVVRIDVNVSYPGTDVDATMQSYKVNF